MTATQAPPADVATSAPDTTPMTAPTGLAGVLGSSDHKVIGRLYVGAALLLGLASGVTGLLGGIDRIDGTLGNTILDGETAPQVVTFHATSATLLFILPALLGLAMVVVPLQVGARAIAFPRAAAASFWTFLVGAALFITAYAINGGPGGGRTDAVDLWAASMGLVILGLLLGAICVATTVLAVRANGMSLDRVPMFAWSLLCTTVIWLLTLPVMLVVLLLVFLGHRNGGSFLGAEGPQMYDQVAWLGRQPQVYAAAIPVLGLVLDVVATAAGARIPNRGVARTAIGAFAVLGIGAFALTAINPDVAQQPVTKGMALLAPLPVLVVLGLVGLTLKGGKPAPTSGLVGGMFALMVLLVATLVGAATPFQGALELDGTQWVTAQSHLTLVAATIALVAGLYHWSTKVLGRSGSEAAGRTAPLVLALGALVLAVPEAISGLTGEVEGEVNEAVTGIEAMNGIAVAGAGLVLLGALLAVAGLVGRRTADTPADPWGGSTLEWATASPPSFANFDGPVPAVTSAAPLLKPTSDDDGEDA